MNRPRPSILKQSFLMMLICVIVMLTGCERTGTTQRIPTATSTPVLDSSVQAWLRQTALPLSTTDPSLPLTDLASVGQYIGNAQIVGLGEETHGTHEFSTMKDRLLRYLVQEQGFTTFALEGNWSAGELANQYVLTGTGDPTTILKNFGFWTWDTQEMLDLLQWIRTYDANPQHPKKVQFAGFDCQQILSITFDSVTQYLQSVDPDKASMATTLYTGIRPGSDIAVDQWTNQYSELSHAQRQQYAVQAQEVYSELIAHKTIYIQHTSPTAFADALQDATVILEFTQFWQFDLLTKPTDEQNAGLLRDKLMAQNVEWLHDQTASGNKLVLWAHNDHIGRLGNADDGTMGYFLGEYYHSLYLSIGFSFFDGSFHAKGMDDTLQRFTLKAPEGSSYNYIFGNIGIPLYLIDLREPPTGTVQQWWTVQRPFLTIGASYDALPSSLYEYVSLPTAWDLIIHIQHTTASNLLPGS